MNFFETDINDFEPSLLNPRSTKKQKFSQFTGRSILSLSLEKTPRLQSPTCNVSSLMQTSCTPISRPASEKKYSLNRSNMVRIKHTSNNSHQKSQMSNSSKKHIDPDIHTSQNECSSGNKCCKSIKNHFDIFPHKQDKTPNTNEQNFDYFSDEDYFEAKTKKRPKNERTDNTSFNKSGQLCSENSKERISLAKRKLYGNSESEITRKKKNYVDNENKEQWIKNWVNEVSKGSFSDLNSNDSDSFKQNQVISSTSNNNCDNEQANKIQSSAPKNLNSLRKKNCAKPHMASDSSTDYSSAASRKRYPTRIYNTRSRMKKSMSISDRITKNISETEKHGVTSKSSDITRQCTSSSSLSDARSKKKKLLPKNKSGKKQNSCNGAKEKSLLSNDPKTNNVCGNSDATTFILEESSNTNISESLIKSNIIELPSKDHKVQIKLKVCQLIDESIVVEACLGSKGWEVRCEAPINTFVVYKNPIRINNDFHVEIDINPKTDIKQDSTIEISSKSTILLNPETEIKQNSTMQISPKGTILLNPVTEIMQDSTIQISPIKENSIVSPSRQSFIDSYFKSQKNLSQQNGCTTNLKNSQDEQCITNTGAEYTRADEEFRTQVREAVELSKSTTILHTLFSSSESIMGEDANYITGVRIKTAEEINMAMQTIIISDDEVEDNAKRQNEKQMPVKKVRKKIKKICPKFKIIDGTPFAVDAFNYGSLRNEGVEIYFLTHFHSDHYVGLTKKFCEPLYCSQITANLLEIRIKFNKKYMNILELNKPVVIKDVEVTALDANHCPGSIMLLFKLRNGSCHLHTGDFRANVKMEFYPQFRDIKVDNLYLDTTYCMKQYKFPSQEESIQMAIDLATKWFTEDRSLLVVGTYLIGKERVWLDLCKSLSRKAWVHKTRRELLNAFDDNKYVKYLTDDISRASIHVMPLQDLTHEKLEKHLCSLEGKFTRILALRPSGWEFRKKPYARGEVTIAGIPYSEHSSYEELKHFVSFLKPARIFATAGNENQLGMLYKDAGLRDPSLNTIDKYFEPLSSRKPKY